MPGELLTTLAQLKCPHGGTVQIVSSNTKVMTGKVPLALANDTFTVVGCPFQIPLVVPVPSPCVVVRWVLSDLKTKVNQIPTLSRSSVGICFSAAQIPQGPVVIEQTQPTVKN